MKPNCKIIALLLSLLLILTPLTGCDMQGDTATDSSSAVSTPESTPESIPESIPESTPESTPESIPESTPEQTPTTSESLPESTPTPTEPTESSEPTPVGSITILKGSELTLEVGKGVRLLVSKSSFITDPVTWTANGEGVTVDSSGYVTALSEGDFTVTATAGGATDSIIIHVIQSTVIPEESPWKPTETLPKSEIHEAVGSPEGYSPAGSYAEAIDRTNKGQLSGYDHVPDQAPIIADKRPMKDGKYVKNSSCYYEDVNTYVVIDALGREVFRVYRGGAYITLEEVAAYVYAFGTVPANHSSSKKTKPTDSIWGKYLRVNNTKFSGDTSRYPYEPELPRISGCGGDLTYWEMDIGTTGTDCDPDYTARIYNNGSSITRGAARLVYTWNDLNGNRMADSTDVIFVFYTYNHYNDFREYLNYYGGWGEMFGNVTGGGTLSSKSDYSPTDYVPVVVGAVYRHTSASATYILTVVDPTALKRLFL